MSYRAWKKAGMEDALNGNTKPGVQLTRVFMK